MNNDEWTKFWCDSDSKWSASVSANGVVKDVLIVVEKDDDGFMAKTLFNGKEYSSLYRPCDSAAVLLLLNRIIVDDLTNGVVELDSVRRSFDWHDDPPTYEEAVEHNENHSVWGSISNWQFWCPMDQTIFVEGVRIDTSDSNAFDESIKEAIKCGAAGWCAADLNGDKVRWPKVKGGK